MVHVPITQASDGETRRRIVPDFAAGASITFIQKPEHAILTAVTD